MDAFNTKKHLLNNKHPSSSGALNHWRTALVTGAEDFSQDLLTALVHGHSRSRYSGFDAEMKSKDMNTRCSLIGDRICIITPARHPVSPGKTQEWLDERRLIQQRGDQLVKGTGIHFAGEKAIAPVTVQADSLAETSVDSIVPVTAQVDNIAEASIDCLLSQLCSQVTSSAPAKHSTPVSKKTRKLPLWPLNFTPVSRQPGSSAAIICPVVCEEIEQKRMIGMDNKFSARSSLSDHSFLDGPTQNNSYGFKVSQHNIQSAKALHEVDVLYTTC